MIRRKLSAITLAMCLSLSVGFIGCGYNNINNGGKAVRNVATATKNSTKNIWSKVNDTSMKYTAAKLISDLKAKGYDLTNTNNNTNTTNNKTISNFSVKDTTYTIDGDKLSVYEYGKNQHNKIKADINSITDNGTKIRGRKVTWTATPHIYKKGRVVVVYDGNNPDIINTLQGILGNSIIG